jgi:hypothetical protein
LFRNFEQVEITTAETEESEIITIETLRYLSEAAKEGWWLPTSILAHWLSLTPSSIVRQGHQYANMLLLVLSLNELNISGVGQFSGRFDLFEISHFCHFPISLMKKINSNDHVLDNLDFDYDIFTPLRV